MIQAQLEHELLRNQIHQRYLEHQHRLAVQHQQHQRNEYEKLPHSTPQKYQPYSQSAYMPSDRTLATYQSHLDNVNDRYAKQLNFNLTNDYYNHVKRASVPPHQTYRNSNSNNNNNTININRISAYTTNTTSTSGRTHNNSDTLNDYLQKPIKMRREEIIIEQSQLVLQGNGNGNENPMATTETQRSKHNTQVTHKMKSITNHIGIFICVNYLKLRNLSDALF